MIIGTFGRAAWVLDDIEPLRQLAKNPNSLKQDIVLFDAPTAYHAANQQPTGTRFGGDALYNGENRPEGGRFTFYYKAQKSMNQKQRLKLALYKDEVLVKTLERKAPDTTGFYRWTWDLTEEAVERPERFKEKEEKDDDDERSGKPALPGTYQATLSYVDSQSKATITLALDPRIEDTETAFNERYQALKSLEEMTTLAAAAVGQVQHSRREVNALKKSLKDSTETEEISSLASKTLTSLIALEALFIGKEDKRQGIVRNPTPHVMTRISRASSYVRTRPAGLTETEQQLIRKTEQQLDAALDSVNAFYKEQWEIYRTQTAALPKQKEKVLLTFKRD